MNIISFKNTTLYKLGIGQTLGGSGDVKHIGRPGQVQFVTHFLLKMHKSRPAHDAQDFLMKTVRLKNLIQAFQISVPDKERGNLYKRYDDHAWELS